MEFTSRAYLQAERGMETFIEYKHSFLKLDKIHEDTFRFSPEKNLKLLTVILYYMEVREGVNL